MLCLDVHEETGERGVKLKWGGRRRPDVTAIKAPVLLSKAKQDGRKGRPPRVEKGTTVEMRLFAKIIHRLDVFSS